MQVSGFCAGSWGSSSWAMPPRGRLGPLLGTCRRNAAARRGLVVPRKPELVTAVPVVAKCQARRRQRRRRQSMQVTAPDRDQLRRLAELRQDRPVVLSLYLNLDPAEFATPPARATAVRSLLDEADRRLRERDGLSPDDRRRSRRSLARARTLLERDLPSRGRPGRGRLRQRVCRPVRGPAPPASGAQPRGDRPLAAGRAAGAARAARALVRGAGEPPRRAHLPRLARRAARDRADPRRGLRPARPRRLVAGSLPARDREGEGRPPQAHRRGADDAPGATARSSA